MQIIEADGKKFLVIETINLERFENDEQRANYVKGTMYARQQNSNIIHIVKEITDAVFEDLPIPTVAEQSASYVSSSVDSLGNNVDVKV